MYTILENRITLKLSEINLKKNVSTFKQEGIPNILFTASMLKLLFTLVTISMYIFIYY